MELHIQVELDILQHTPHKQHTPTYSNMDYYKHDKHHNLITSITSIITGITASSQASQASSLASQPHRKHLNHRLKHLNHRLKHLNKPHLKHHKQHMPHHWTLSIRPKLCRAFACTSGGHDNLGGSFPSPSSLSLFTWCILYPLPPAWFRISIMHVCRVRKIMLSL